MTYHFDPSMFPDEPGVYIMKDAGGVVIYVGKAKSLRKRLSNYFQESHVKHPVDFDKVSRLVASIDSIDTIVTNNEREALLLENELIKKYLPRFNVRMRDDKSFPYVMITCTERFPRVAIIRGIKDYPRENLFFGPFVDKKAVRKTLRMIRKVIPFCDCKSEITRKKKPCLYSHIGLCSGPCARVEDEAFRQKYLEDIKRLVAFLRGDYSGLMENLKAEMHAAAGNMEFERAASFRDKIIALEKVFHPQSVFSIEYSDMDVLNLSKNDEELIILVLEVRNSRLINKVPFIFDRADNVETDGKILSSFLLDHYGGSRDGRNIRSNPKFIVVNKKVEDHDLVENILREFSGNTIEAILEGEVVGDQLKPLFDIARKNAFFILHSRKMNRDLARFDQEDALEELAGVLGLDEPPDVIEGYDISNLQGKDATGSKVCFKRGKPYKKEYRRYKIRSEASPDDYRMMAEVITRRFQRIKEGRDAIPDLILIDGGKGQLQAAIEAMEALGFKNYSIIGLAKKKEEVFLPGSPEPIQLPGNSKARLLLQSIRDESHRFAITYHKKLRKKHLDELEEKLLEIPGIGPARARVLRKYFKTLDAIKNAPLKELVGVLGSRKAAGLVHEFFHGTATLPPSS